jgi:8-oxo-dGTP diphosphatase
MDIPRDVRLVDWAHWKPSEWANLCFVMKDGQILLIRKKRGLGAGKINGPGGRLEPGETAEQAAVREVQEELGVTPTGLEKIGELFFQFMDDYRLHVVVFRADDCEGELIETNEAAPLWTDVDKVPYEEMWEDDPYWLPLVMARRKFRGYFIFDGSAMQSHRVEMLP